MSYNSFWATVVLNFIQSSWFSCYSGAISFNVLPLLLFHLCRHSPRCDGICQKVANNASSVCFVRTLFSLATAWFSQLHSFWFSVHFSCSHKPHTISSSFYIAHHRHSFQCCPLLSFCVEIFIIRGDDDNNTPFQTDCQRIFFSQHILTHIYAVYSHAQHTAYEGIHVEKKKHIQFIRTNKMICGPIVLYVWFSSCCYNTLRRLLSIVIVRMVFFHRSLIISNTFVSRIHIVGVLHLYFIKRLIQLRVSYGIV